MPTDGAGRAIDLTKVQAEINDEVRRRRAAGDFPPGLERELDALFARYAPAGVGDDFDEVILQAETHSFMHVDVPTDSSVPGVAYVKRAIRKVLAWYLRFLASQVTAFAGAVTRAVRLLSERVDTLERVTVVAAERTLAEIRERRSGPDLSVWTELVLKELTHAPGRVLHTECGAGGLMASLAEAGAEVYGVEPVEALVIDASRAGLEVRADDALTHLRALPHACLGGLILSGAVDALPLGEVLEVLDRATAVVDTGGTIIILSAGVPTDPVVADLAPGRPLHPETWVHLLRQRGVGEVTVQDAAGPERGPYAVVARRHP